MSTISITTTIMQKDVGIMTGNRRTHGRVSMVVSQPCAPETQEAARHIIRYPLQTRDHGILFTHDGKGIEGYAHHLSSFTDRRLCRRPERLKIHIGVDFHIQRIGPSHGLQRSKNSSSDHRWSRNSSLAHSHPPKAYMPCQRF